MLSIEVEYLWAWKELSEHISGGRVNMPADASATQFETAVRSIPVASTASSLKLRRAKARRPLTH